MNKNTVLVLAAIAAVVAWQVHSKIEADRIALERVNLENGRVSAQDPLKNLAGCMANRATSISQIAIARSIYKTDTKKEMSKDEITQYESIRNALLEACSPQYLQKALDGYETLTYPELNYVFMEVMRQDPSVQRHIQMFEEVDAASKSAYVTK